MSLAALTQGGRLEVPTAVPSAFRKLWISRSELSHPEATCVKAAAWNTASDSRGNEFDISVLDTSLDHVLVHVEGVRLTTVGDISVADDHVQLAEDLASLSLSPSLNTVDNDQIFAYCNARTQSEPEPLRFYQSLSFVLYAFLAQTIDALGPTKPDQPHLRKYVRWAISQLEKHQDDHLRDDPRSWRHLIEDHQAVRSLCAFVETNNDQGRVFVTTGRNLLQILRGDTDPLQFLFESGLMKDLYREINNNRDYFLRLDRYLAALSHTNPDMKILEVGAGTGGTTAQILRSLSTNKNGQPCIVMTSSYDYTDVSPSFFEQARSDFHTFPWLNFMPLDIEADPVRQGYRAGSYDMIIAANVLHATKSMNNTLQNVRKLLAPGGNLIMYETTRPDILWTGFVTGLMAGWWVSDEGYRPWGPCLSTEEWDEIL